MDRYREMDCISDAYSSTLGPTTAKGQTATIKCPRWRQLFPKAAITVRVTFVVAFLDRRHVDTVERRAAGEANNRRRERQHARGPNTSAGHDDLCGRCTGAARLSRRTPFRKSKAVLVRRVGRPL